MGEKTVTVTVDPINRGIDRYDTDIRRGKIVEGLNVINDDGDLRRRDSFKSIYTVAPHYFPPGLAQVYFSNGAFSGESVSIQANRSGTIAAGTTSRIYVGCEEKFHGFEISEIASSSQTPSYHTDIKAYYRKVVGVAKSWTEIDWTLDTTTDRHGGSELIVPWSKNGRISWHTEEISADWGSDQGAIGRGGGTLGYGRDGATELYWICVEVIKRGSSDLLAPTVNIVVSAPGIRCFALSRVNGLFPIRTKGKSMTVICSDRLQTRGNEAGAMAGVIEDNASQTKRINFASTQGSGAMDVLTWPNYKKTGAGNTTYADAGTGTTTYSSSASNVMARFKQPTDVDWFPETSEFESEWRGGKAIEIPVAKVVTASSTSTKVKVAIADSPPLTNCFANQFEHYLMRILADDDGGSANEERMIYKNTASDGVFVTFYVDDAFTAAPEGTLYIYRPHNRLRMEPSAKDYEVFTNEESTITPLVARPWAPETTDVDNKSIHYFVGPNPRWFLKSGEMYSAVFSLGDQKLILSNGEGPLITFDGKDLRVMVPHSDVTTDYIAALYAGMVGHSDEQIKQLAASGLTEKGKLRSNPLTGSTLTTFNDHVFISNADDIDYQIMYSGGMKATDIWPVGYEFHARDEDSRKIQGMRSFGPMLAIWTASEIMGFRFGRTDADRMVPVTLSPGFGFMSHGGVQKVRGALVGPNSDGIYAFSGREPTPIVDDWKRIIKKGINVERLDRATAVNLYHKSWYIVAVPQAGSNKNDRLVVWDYARNQVWVWSAPYGASFLARDLDENGSERLLVGTDDGYIQTLVSSELDDAKSIDSYARTPTMNPFGPNESALVELQVTAENKSSTQPLRCKIFVAKRDAESKSINLSTDASQALLASFTLDTSAVGDDRYKTKKASLNAKGHDFQIEVGGQYQWRLRRLFITARPLGRR